MWVSSQVSFKRNHWVFDVCPRFCPFMFLEDVSKHQDILTWRQLLVHQSLGVMQSITFATVIRDADEPCSVKTAWAPESSFHSVTSEYDSTFILLKIGF